MDVNADPGTGFAWAGVEPPSQGLMVRSADDEDVRLMQAIADEAFGVGQFDVAAALLTDLVLCARHDTELVGFSVASLDEGMTLKLVVVHPHYRRRGIGTELGLATLGLFTGRTVTTQARLSCGDGNPATAAFLRGLGFSRGDPLDNAWTRDPLARGDRCRACPRATTQCELTAFRNPNRI